MKHSHPGPLLTRRYLEPLGLKAQDLAVAMGISKSQLSRVLNGKCAITADVALRLEFVLGASAEMWMNVQREHDLAVSREGFDASKLTCLTHLWNDKGLEGEGSK
ncbi:HigA family addiction module antitoxin (plasmid) [Pseudomonas silesiensis]|uniref:HigA family addiction module antitoxin n=1 Tax=Pseudomonas silesiensis TaxID=1853130 RepID=UPI0030CD6349